MTQLQVVKTPPQPSAVFLMRALGEGKEVTRFNLYEDRDYDRLVFLIFTHDEVISWW